MTQGRFWAYRYVMAGRDQGALGLLECLHAAPGNPAVFLRFLDALQQAISPGGLVIHVAYAREDRPGILAGPAVGLREADLEEFLTEFRHPAASEIPRGSVLPVPAESGFYRTRFFEETLAPAGVCPGPGLAVVLERTPTQIRSASLVLPGAAGWAPTPADCALLDQLAPHMEIARRLHLRVAHREREEEALVSAFDRLALGVVFTDDAGSISYANRSASELIGHPAGFSEPDAILDDHTRGWRDLLRGESGRGTVVRAPDDGRPIQVLDSPLEWATHETLAANRFARAFFIADPKQRTGDPIQVLREMFGLTGSETRLATLLLADCSLKEAASLLDITQTTARGVLKTIFAKTGTNRQAELLRLLLRGPMGQLRARTVKGATRQPGTKAHAGGNPRRRAN